MQGCMPRFCNRLQNATTPGSVQRNSLLPGGTVYCTSTPLLLTVFDLARGVRAHRNEHPGC
eukprot:15300140-Alexandrium_andersonii.AAC.1